MGSLTNRLNVPMDITEEFQVLDSATAAPPLPNPLRVESITNQANRGSCQVTSDEQRVEYAPKEADGVGNARCGYQICDSRDVCTSATVYINVIPATGQVTRTSANNLNVEDIPDTEGNLSVSVDTVNGEDLAAVVGTDAAVEKEQEDKQDDEQRIVDAQLEDTQQVLHQSGAYHLVGPVAAPAAQEDEGIASVLGPKSQVALDTKSSNENDVDGDDIFTWKDERLSHRQLWQFWSGRDQWNANSWSQPSWGGSKSSKVSTNGRRKWQNYWDDDDGRVWGKIKGSARRRCNY